MLGDEAGAMRLIEADAATTLQQSRRPAGAVSGQRADRNTRPVGIAAFERCGLGLDRF